MEKIRRLYKKYIKNDPQYSNTTEKKFRKFPVERIDRWDKEKLRKIYFKYENKPGFRNTARIISLFGDPRLWLIILPILAIYGIIISDLSVFTVYITGFVQSYLIYFIIKNMIKRPRPFVEFDDIQNLDKTGHGYSFPSGHSHHSTILMGLTLLYLIQNPLLVIIPLILYNCCVTYSRIISGCHYPFDVIFGVIEGYAELALHWFVTAPIYLGILAYLTGLII